MEKDNTQPGMVELAKIAAHRLETDALPFSKETKKEHRLKSSHPSLGAEENFLFIENHISPAIKDLAEAKLKIEFGRFPYNPERDNEFIMYDGFRLHLCVSTGDGENEFSSLGEIGRKDDLATRHHRGWDRAIDSFGRVSKEHIFFQVKVAVKSLYSDFERVEQRNEQRLEQQEVQQPAISLFDKAGAFVTGVFHKKT